MHLAVVRAVTLGLLLICAGAQASTPETVVVVSADPGFVRAIAAVLGAAGVRAVAIADVEEPAGAELTTVPRQLADREHATAVVVLGFGADGATLIAYDREVDRALVRVLHDRAPLGPRQSAEAAQMVRTMLRAVRVPAEREAPPPEPQEAIAPGAAPAQDPPALSPASVAPDAGVLAVALAGGLRVGSPGSASRAGGDVQLIWRPDAPGLAATVSLAGAARVDAASFAGTVSDTVGAVTARLPIGLAPGWRLIGELGGAVHRFQLAGAPPGPMGPMRPMKPMGAMGAMGPIGPMDAMGAIHIVRYDPALRLGASVMYVASPSISAGVAARVDVLVDRQDLRMASQPILDVPAAQVTVALTLVARIL